MVTGGGAAGTELKILTPFSYAYADGGSKYLIIQGYFL